MAATSPTNNDKTKALVKTGTEIFSALLMAGGWGVALLSIAPYLLHWRVANEPGYSAYPKVLLAIYCFFSIGGLVFISAHIYLLVQKAWTWLIIAWVLCLGEMGLAILFSPALLVFLV